MRAVKKKMYITEFWCGVLACLGAELIGVILLAISLRNNDKKVESSDDIQKPILDDNNKN